MEAHMITEQRKQPPAPNLKSRKLFKNWIPPLAVLVLFLCAWQFGLQLLDIPSYLLPKPTDVMEAARLNMENLQAAALTTAIESLIGFLLSVVFGIAGAIVLASSRIVERSFYPYVIILQTIPIVAIAPIIVIWFGAGMNAIVIITFLMGFFPMLSNTLIGLRATDRNLRNLFKIYHASRLQTLVRLRLPAALPYIVGGLKISCTLSVIGTIVGEYIAGIGGSQGGLGYAITMAATRLETPYLFACGLAVSLLGIVFYLLVSLLAKVLLSSWHESEMKMEK